jgi:hypothetical protein
MKSGGRNDRRDGEEKSNGTNGTTIYNDHVQRRSANQCPIPFQYQRPCGKADREYNRKLVTRCLQIVCRRKVFFTY